MKKYFLLFVLLQANNFCFAQTDQTQDYKWGIGLELNSLNNIKDVDIYSYSNNYFEGETQSKSYALGIKCNYFFNNKSALRLRIGLTQIKFNYSSTQPIILSTYSAINKQTNYDFTFGILWQVTYNKLHIYSGFEIPVNIYGNFELDERFENYVNGTLDYTSTSNSKLDGGLSYGLGGFTGFNFQLLQNFSMGFELSSAFLHYKTGGDLQFDGITYDANGVMIGETKYIKQVTFNKSDFSSPQASLNLTLHF